MKVAVLEGKGIINIYEKNIEFPENWAKIKVESTGICGSDLNFWFGDSLDLVKGKILGHEVSGTILQLPEGYKGSFKVGDRVVIEPLIGCGKCEYCKSGKYYLCRELKHIGIYYPGGFAEITASPIEKLFLLPSDLSHDLAALADVVAVAVHCINIFMDINIRRNVDTCIVGDGPVALSIVAILKGLMNLNNVSVIGKHSRNLELAKSIGAKTIISEDVDEAVYDVVIEAVGGRRGLAAFHTCLNILKPGGTLIVLGQYYKRFHKLDLHRLVNEELKLIGSFSYGIHNGESELKIALEIISKFKNYFEAMITHRINLNNISKGFEIAANKDKYKSIKVMIKPNQGGGDLHER